MTATETRPFGNDHDYNVCPETTSGLHDPIPALMADPDNRDLGYFTVECTRCFQTTGYPMPDTFDNIEW